MVVEKRLLHDRFFWMFWIDWIFWIYVSRTSRTSRISRSYSPLGSPLRRCRGTSPRGGGHTLSAAVAAPPPEGEALLRLVASKIFAAFGKIGEQAGEKFVRQTTINHFPAESSLIVVFLEDSKRLFKRNRAEEGG